jgi:glycerophosphoryl diester phosphodiesterase
VSHFRPWPWPRVLAHRGAGALAPENTLAALRVGCERGFRAVEFDAMAPLDDVAVLMHDATLERTTGAAGAVTARSAGELARLDAGAWHSAQFAHEPVPTLEQALSFCRSHSIWPNVEIKPAPGHERRTGTIVAHGVARAYADVVRPGGDAGPHLDPRVPLLSSFEEDALVAARAAVPDLPRALLIDEVPEDWQSRLERLGAVSLHTNHGRLAAATARAIKQAGYWLFCYTVDDPERARELLAWGVDAFCTDRIDLVRPDFA